MDYRIATVTVPWAGLDTYKGVALATSGFLGVLIVTSLVRSLGVLNWYPSLLFVLFLLEGILLATAVYIGKRHSCRPWADLGFSSVNLTHIFVLPALVLFTSLTLTSIYFLIVNGLGLGALSPPFSQFPDGLLLGGAKWSMALILVLWAPLAEETFFRGFLLQGLAPQTGLVWSVVISSAVFSVSHGMVGLLIPAFISGILLGWLFLRTRCIWSCCIAHALQNSLALLL